MIHSWASDVRQARLHPAFSMSLTGSCREVGSFADVRQILNDN